MTLGIQGSNPSGMIARRSILAGLSVLLFAPVAAAQVTVRYRARHRTGRLVEYVLGVLGAHEQACDSGCKFRAPDVERSIVLEYQRTKERYYIWTHVDAFKDARTFQKVTISRNGGRTVFRVATPSASEIERLKQHTKLPHEPLLDSLWIKITVDAPNKSNGSLTNVYYEAEARASGMVGMFDGVIRRSLKANAEAIFANIEK